MSTTQPGANQSSGEPESNLSTRTRATLTLGTAQFGLPYGVANRSGRPDRTHVKAMLTAAYDGGIRSIDTAAAYGSSEEVLGDSMSELGLSNSFRICTKIRVLSDLERSRPDLSRKSIQESLENSLSKLKVERLSSVLFHRDADYELLDILREYQQRGWIERIGVSASNSDIAVPIWLRNPSKSVDAIQVPGSVVDLRYLSESGVRNVAKHGGLVFVRSVYLQGLLLLDENQIPEHLKGILPVRRFLETTARNAGMGVQELCLRFLLGWPGVSSLVVGMETFDQLQENLQHWSKGPLPSDLAEKIRCDLPPFIPDLLVPGSWETLRKPM